MELKECVNNILIGLNRREIRHTSNDKTYTYNLLTIRSVNNKFINKEELEEYDSLTEIDDKYLTKKDDVIICSKPPYNVVLIDEEDEGILIPSHFIILRDSKINSTYLYNYLNLIGSKMKFDEADENTNIKKTDVEQIKIKYDEKMIEKISDLSMRINKRQKAYGKLLDNDQELIKMVYVKGGAIKDE